MTRALYERRHAAKLAGRRSRVPVAKPPWFLPWSLHRFVGPPRYRRPRFPEHITTREYGWVLDEWARYSQWRQRIAAHVKRPALGLWPYGRVPEYAWTVAEAQEAAHPAPPPSPKPPPTPPPSPNPLLVERAQRVMFTAWRPLDGLRARGGRITIAADLNCGGNPSQHIEWAKQAVRAAKEHGKEPSVWGNQSQVGIDHMYAFTQQIEAAYTIWQAETIGELVDVGITETGSIRPGSPLARSDIVLVGNPNAWTAAQREKATELVYAGRLAVIFETYTNCGDPWPALSSSAGVPPASIAPGVGWDRSPYQLPAYKSNTPASQWPTISPYLAEDFDESSWAALPW